MGKFVDGSMLMLFLFGSLVFENYSIVFLF